MGVYRKGKKWRVVIWLDGKREDWIVEGNKEEARAFEARKLVELQAGKPREHRTAPTFAAFCVLHYRPYAEPRLKTRTWSNRIYTLDALEATFGELRLTEITRAEVEHYQNDRLNAKPKPIRPSTINDEVKVLRTVLSYARSLGVPCSTLDVSDLPVRGKRKVKAWTKDEVAALLEAVRESSPQLYGVVLFLLNTGCRKGEALAMQWTCIDLKRRLVRVEPSEEWQPKNGQAREIPISRKLYKWLRAAPRARYVFPSDEGDRYAFWPQRAFDRARDAAGLHGGPHTTRHTYATHFLQKRPDLFLLARILGHSDITVTKLYSHLLPDHLERARDAVDFGL